MSENTHKISSKTPWMVAEETIKLMSALNLDNGEARFVGGCVRDVLANRKSYDIDIAVNYPPELTIERLRSHNIKCVETGIAHGTVTAVINGKPFEITSLRKDIENYGRHAKVEFTDNWAEDAARRDFTFNAISTNMSGEVFDYYDGVEDLRLGRVKFIGNASDRIKEDYLRILRYFRFFGIFSKEHMSEDVAEAIKLNVAGLSQISKERITLEFIKILSLPKCAHVVELMHKCGVLDVILPNEYAIEALHRLEKLEAEYNNIDNPIRRLAILLDDVKNVSEYLRLSNYQYKDLENIKSNSSELDLSISKDDLNKLTYKYGSDNLRSMLLYVAAKGNDVTNLPELYEQATRFLPPRFPIKGDDVKALGVAEGRAIGDILKELESWWLDNNFQPKRVDCLEKLKEIASKY